MTPRRTTLSTPHSPADEHGTDTERQVLLDVTDLTITMETDGERRTLVRDVDLRLGRGQTLGIVGESGSGKSLTARAIVGLLPAGLRTAGSVVYDGTEVIGTRERTLRAIRGSGISLLLQDPFTMLNPLQTVGAHLTESLPAATRRDKSEARKEVLHRLDEVGLQADVADRYPFQLSGGMRQRVALAAALAGDPGLLIADEPTTALDVTTQAEVLRLLKAVQERRGMASILITHDLRVAFSVCDRIQVMYAGSVVEESATADLRTGPAHPYSHGLLLAEPPLTYYVDHLVSIPGKVPRADAVADRCSFADRCGWSTPVCVGSRPAPAALDGGRSSACVRLPEIRHELTGESDAVEHSPSAQPVRPEGKPLATLTDVRKTFRTTRLIGRSVTSTALGGVSLTIGEGESVGLVGETGSGKTTIARSILGLVTPDSGSVLLDGVDASDYRRMTRAERRRIRRFVQVVFQDPYASLNPSLKVGVTLREALNARGAVGDPAAEVADLLARVGLPVSYADRKPGSLSGGERQRVAIARAIAVEPALLICDEPVAALDVSAQAQVLELLREIRRASGMSMLFITHDLSVVRQMTDRVVVLYRGDIVEVGDTAAVLDTPQHAYTRRLLDAVPGIEQRAVGSSRQGAGS